MTELERGLSPRLPRSVTFNAANYFHRIHSGWSKGLAFTAISWLFFSDRGLHTGRFVVRGKWTQLTAIRPERTQWGQLRGRLNKERAGETLQLSCKLLTYQGFLCPPAHLVDMAILY